MRKTMSLLLSGLILISLVSGAIAQPGQEFSPERREMRIRMLRTWRLIEELDLTEEQSTKFFPIMNRFDDKEREINQKRRRIMVELREVLSRDNASEKEIKEKIAALRNGEQERHSNRDKFYEDVAKVLSVSQQARLLLFEERFQREVREIIRDFRERRERRLREHQRELEP